MTQHNPPNPASSWCPPSNDTGAGDPSSGQDRRQMVASDAPASTTCHLGWRPLLLTGTLRQILIQHFADPDNIEDPDLRQLVWRKAPPSGIMVESVWRWTPEQPESRPAILLKRNSYRNQRISLRDSVGLDGQGNEHFQTLWVGSHTLFCIHGSGASSEILASEVQRELTQFSPVIQKSLGLVRLQVIEVGAVSKLAESRDSYVVPVNVGWCYQEAWKIAMESLPLRGVSLEIDVDPE